MVQLHPAEPDDDLSPAGSLARPRLLVYLAAKTATLVLLAWQPVTAALIWCGLSAWMLLQIFLPRAGGLGRVHARFRPQGREVWLTIDDGPDPEQTPKILAALQRHDARATFFVIGRQVEAHPALIRAIVDAGHEIALHTHTHPTHTFWRAGPQRIAREIAQNRAAVRHAARTINPTRFRAPVGFKSPWLHPELRARGLRLIAWETRACETRGAAPDRLLARLWRGVRPGAILLLHEGEAVPPSARVIVIERTLDRLTAEGYRCVIPSDDRLV